jgi:hypothetical protein
MFWATFWATFSRSRPVTLDTGQVESDACENPDFRQQLIQSSAHHLFTRKIFLANLDAVDSVFCVICIMNRFWEE